LYGLKEEFELRDFALQLRQQVEAVSGGRALALGPMGSSSTMYPSSSPRNSATVGAGAGGAVLRGTALSPYRIGGDALKGPSGSRTDWEEKTHTSNAAPLVASLHQSPSILRTPSTQGGRRDLAVDLAEVRALQEQDRILTQAYSRIIPEPGR
jgi:hypothetical protein